MRFEPSRQNAHEMYLALGWEKYLAPTREIDPYIGLSMATSGYGLLDDDARGGPATYSLNNSDPELDELATGISRREWNDPVEAMLGARTAFSERVVGDLLELIEKRESMRDQHMREIDGESCQAKTRIFGVEQWHPAVNRDADRVRANAEKEMSGLEREKRMEEIACWRDVSRLRMELHERASLWHDEKRRQSFLRDDGP